MTPCCETGYCCRRSEVSPPNRVFPTVGIPDSISFGDLGEYCCKTARINAVTVVIDSCTHFVAVVQKYVEFHYRFGITTM